MQIVYDKEKNVVEGNEYSIGSSYGNPWKAEPIKVELCKCGQPLVAYFMGKAPTYMKEKSRCGGDYEVYQINGAWSFHARTSSYTHKCPACHKNIFEEQYTEEAKKERETRHEDIEASIIINHGEECTCSLCME